MLEVEVLDSSSPPARPQSTGGVRAVAISLALVAIGQGIALAENRGLPAAVRLTVPDAGYTVGTPSDPALVVFQLDNPGPALDLKAVLVAVPGLELVDVVAAGSSTGGRTLGEGEQALPTFRLVESVTLSLRFEVTDCDAIDDRPYPVRVQLQDGRRRGEVPLTLRDYPDLSGDGGADLRWQQVLAFAVCPAT